MMITKTCDRKKKETNRIFVSQIIVFYNKQWYNIYLGVLDLSNDI